MPVIHRQNAIGLKFMISNIGSPNSIPTTITLVEGKRPPKEIKVQHSLEAINQGFYFWMHGKHVQHAFPFLNANEREFLMTGITPTEWDKIFEDSEDHEDS